MPERTEYTVTLTALQFGGPRDPIEEVSDTTREVTFKGDETRSLGTNKSIFEKGPARDNLVLEPALGIANFHVSMRVTSLDGVEVKLLQSAYEASVGGIPLVDDGMWTLLYNGGQLRLGSGSATLVFRVRVALKA